MCREIGKPQRARHLVKKPNYPTPVREFAEALSLLVAKPMRQQPVEVPIRGENRERSVTSAGELAGGSNNILAHGLPIQARRDPMAKPAEQQEPVPQAQVLSFQLLRGCRIVPEGRRD